MKQLLIIASLLISLNSLGQFSLGPALYLGKSEISNNLTVVRTETKYTEPRNSYVIGIFNEYKFNNWFSV